MNNNNNTIVCLVTGATRGVGKGIALAFGEKKYTVYITGRTVEEFTIEKRLGGSLNQTKAEVEALGGICIPIKADSSNDDEMKAVLDQIEEEQGHLDILVNNAFRVPKPASQFFSKPFFEQDTRFLDEQYNVGCRNHFVLSTLACPLLFKANRTSLIVNISSAGGQNHLFSVSYGMIKTMVDRMSVDMGIELKEHNKNTACISLWPGVVKTERMILGAKLMGGKETVEKGETPQFVGRTIAALYNDENILEKSGKIWSTRKLGDLFNVTDVDGKKFDVDINSEPRVLTVANDNNNDN
eukprot:TRINITY_DN2034_c0_g1_i1.p1 TRINITY_DN2034_c0_g1~~TRINITY_DN2034_c0_g1_i1.p1  ORF type:complete len:297 (-),score=103.94 TRINITY_DN2034_c0_g1_i1:283-1173(-)